MKQSRWQSATTLAAVAGVIATAVGTAGSFTGDATAKKGNPLGCRAIFVAIQRKASRNRFMERFFATCPRGLELPIAEELRQLNAEKIHAVGGGVQFAGDFSLCYRINLKSRIASRVLWQVAHGGYRAEDHLYRAAYAPGWTDWLDAAQTIRVDLSATRSPLTSLNFATLKIKDAVCDKIRRLSGRRPSVDTHHPDIPIQGHLTDRDFR